MRCRSNNNPMKKLISVAVLGIFVFASYSVSASFAFVIHTEFYHDQNNSSSPLYHIQIDTHNLPCSPASQRSDEEELPAALRTICEAFNNPGTYNPRTRNKMLFQSAERFLTSDNDSSPLPTILESSFHGSKNICAKAFLSFKTTRKLE